MLGDRLGGDRFRILIVGMLRDGMRLIRRCRLILRGGIVQRHIGRSLMRRGARLLRPLLVHEPESAERLGKHRTQLGHALRDGRLTRLQLGDAPLKILVEGDKALLNQYSVMMVNPAKCPKVKQEAAKKFINWWISPNTQKAIASFQLEGKQLFFPNAKAGK